LAEAIAKTQEAQHEWAFPAGKRQTFIDKLTIAKKGIPGVGAYAQKESAQDKCLSVPPVALRRRR